MTIEQLIILAIIQGLTEFLPISSSAHLILLPELTEWPDQGPLIDVAVHVGSLFAVVAYFRKDVLGLFAGLADVVRRQDTANGRLLLRLIVATLPILPIGIGLYVTGVVDLLRNVEVIGWTTIIFALVLLVADSRGAMNRTADQLTFGGALAIGVAQCLSLIPGTSRAGITITMARSLGYVRTEAARFSMLLALPTISGFGLLALLDVVESGDAVLQRDAAFALVLSFAAAFASIWVFMRLLQRMSLWPFVVYRLILGAGLLTAVYVYGV